MDNTHLSQDDRIQLFLQGVLPEDVLTFDDVVELESRVFAAIEIKAKAGLGNKTVH